MQFYGYSNTIADKKSCYRVPCIYEWYENNAAWTLIMKDFMQDNLTALWKILYEKIWVIMQKIKTNKRIKTYKGIEAEKKEQGITKSV